MKRVLLAFLLVFGLSLNWGMVSAADFYVESSGSCGGKAPCYSTIQEAINAASTGSVIRIAQGTYDESFVLNESKSLTLQGGWNPSYSTQTSNTTFIKAPKTTQGSLTLQMVTIKSASTLPSIPSDYLLITAAQLSRMQEKVQCDAPDWIRLLNNVNAEMGDIDYWSSSPENIALVYLLTRDTQYASAALNWAQDTMTLDVRFDSYLYFGDYMRRVAVVLNYCWDALNTGQRNEMQTYLDQWTHELWFDNQGSGWGLEDPGNNYHMAFLEGTAFAGYALRRAGHPGADTYIEILRDKLDKQDGVMNYLESRTPGGDWPEGVNYGQRSKQRLFAALSVIASMDRPNYFRRSAFFGNSIYYAHYQLQPGNVYIYPGGDLAREETMPVTPYERDYLQTVTYWLTNGDDRRFGQWYLENIVPDYEGPGFNSRGDYYKEMIYKLDLASLAQNSLPLSYRAGGTDWLNFRSGWESDATSVSLSGSPVIDQSHAHHDTGSFTLWKKGWLAMDANTLSNDGLLWEPGAHNMPHVYGSERRDVPSVPGLTRTRDHSLYAYLQFNGTNLFRKRGWPEDELLMNEWTREFIYLKPDTVVVYDRTDPKPGNTYDLRFHFPAQPTLASGCYTTAYGGGGIALLPLVSGAVSLHQDTDLGYDYQGSDAWRVQELPSSTVGRFLNVLQVSSGSPPVLTAQHVTTTTGVMEGALWNNEVVLFSTQAFGAASAVPFSYTIHGTGVRTHTLLNMTGGYEIYVSREGGQTTVTITGGTTYPADAQGILRATL